MPPSASQLSEEPGLQADQALVDRGWLRIGAGAAVAGQAMVFSLAVNLSEISGAAYAVVHGILIVSAVLVFVFLGRDLVRSAWDALVARRISIDLLFLVTLAGAFAGSLIGTFARTGPVYYEVVSILIVVHTAGRMLGARSRLGALRAADETLERFAFCRVVGEDGSVATVSAQAVPCGARVAVTPGEAISVDGVVLSGRGYVQETPMTGEWKPAQKAPGDRVLAGTWSVDGTLEIKADGGRRRLDRVLETVREARLAPSRLQQQADRLVQWFLPLVLVASGGTFVWWLLAGPWDRALFNSMAVLLVACPCAMGLATPVAVWSGLSKLAAFGLVARTGDIIDVLAGADLVFIDKTGTLSEPAMEAGRWKVAPGFAGTEAWLRSAVACAEGGLAHPVAQALRQGGAEAGFSLESRRIVPGCGLVAVVRDPAGNRRELAIGERELGSVEGDFPEKDAAAGRVVWVFSDGKWVACVEVSEKWRPGWEECLRELGGLGLEVEVLSGDPGAGERLAGLVAVKAGLSAEEKRNEVEARVRAGRTVLFVGDGINDAPAMEASQGAIAMRGGAGLARASAQAVFAGDDLRFLPRAVTFARSVRRTVRANLYFAAGYNLAGVALAAAGLLHPVAAALLMLGSSVFVSAHALRATGRAALSLSGR